MNYEEAINYIHTVPWQGCKPGLERITELCRRMGDPQKELRFIHVAGTNGKGSFCAMLESILRASGYEAGMFTSPFVEHFEERIQIAGQPISHTELAEVTGYVAQFADEMKEPPTEFELITAIGLEYFRRKRCRVVIMECGLGGALDSTNVIPSPILAVITGISKDHTALLGDTVEKIAGEKAGIIKPGSMVLYGGEHDGAEKVILDTAAIFGCSCYGVDYSLLEGVRMSIDGTDFDYGRYENLHIPLLGVYQPYNAARVITATELLRQGGVKITDESVRTGLAQAVWKARFELLGRDPDVVFDGAHNPEGMKYACESIAGYYPNKKIALIMGVMKDKDYETMVDTCAPLTERAFTVTPSNKRALPSDELSRVFGAHGVYSSAHESFDDAVKEAYTYAKSNGVPLICLGSLYSYADFKHALEKLGISPRSSDV